MSNRPLLITASAGLIVATVCLALAAALDSAVLAVAGAAVVFAVLVAKESWMRSGEARRWLVTIGGLALVVAAAFLFQTLTG
jgi:hypothetical protein